MFFAGKQDGDCSYSSQDEIIDLKPTYERKHKIRFKVTSVDQMILKAKRLCFVTTMLAETKTDFGIKQLITDFRNCLYCEILEQFYGGEMSMTFQEQNKKILNRLQQYVVRGLHSHLFKQ